MPCKSSIGAKLFSKVEILVEISKISKNLENLKIDQGKRSCSTSYLSGNLVDGSPLVAIFSMKSNTKTIAKRARVKPRTQVHVTMKILF